VPFTIPTDIDPKVRVMAQQIQGVLYALLKAKKVGGGGGQQVIYQSSGVSGGGTVSVPVSGGGGVVEEYPDDLTIHGDLFVDGTIHGTVDSAVTVALDPDVTNATGSRSMGTIYQNTSDTMMDVRVSMEMDFSGWISTTTRIASGDSPYTVLETDHIIFCDTDGGAIEVDLHAAPDGAGLKIINCGSSGNDVTVDPNGTEELFGGGAGVASTLADGEIIDIHYNDTEGWW